jgi:cytochrome c peroxidase
VALSKEQKSGFNLFMGKAACGTCHFTPLFNGSTPPFYDRTEYEVLGIPELSAVRAKEPDADPGRYRVYRVDVYRRAFKTPTVRNSRYTQPYMHNGCYKNLDEVLDFYNRGGGRGLGLNVPGQSLPDKPLHLSKAEMHDIISFLNALTDHMDGI